MLASSPFGYLHCRCDGIADKSLGRSVTASRPGGVQPNLPYHNIHHHSIGANSVCHMERLPPNVLMAKAQGRVRFVLSDPRHNPPLLALAGARRSSSPPSAAKEWPT
jgi:hypothetical protein